MRIATITEVYSRITGYYRPVQNWNDGKSQEYKDRAVYNIETSVMKKAPKSAQTAPVIETSASIADGIYLFATATCPNCKIASALLDRAGVDYIKMYAEEVPELTMDLGIKQAPTLLVVKGGATEKFSNVSEIKKFIG